MKQHIFEFTGKYTHFEKKTMNPDEARELLHIAQVLSANTAEITEFKTCTMISAKCSEIDLHEDLWLH